MTPFGFDARNSDSRILKPDDGLFVPKKIDVLPRLFDGVGCEKKDP